ncbi:MAG: restriction endonuclease [Alphaproteobacteria bacterium]|nr:MAG: restriction endonuclease [Alphaproteobacteria bacterium]
MKTPIKPFDTFKWRWLSVQPTESLLKPSIFLGVLRALKECEGLSPSDQQVFNLLKIVEEETHSPVTLARDTERNLLRNSGQYWKGTGLLLPSTGKIELTDLGKKVSSGQVTQGEFAAIMVQQTILPNPATYAGQEVKKWEAANLRIKPLALILEILESLGEKWGAEAAFLTPNELIKIVIPLSGNKITGDIIADYLAKYRVGKIDISQWPDCAPAANDKRLAREFLLFLSHYGICRETAASKNQEAKFFLDELFDVEAVSSITASSIFVNNEEANNVISAIRSSSLPSIIERQRTKTTVLSRPQQPKFRKYVLHESNNRCLLTGEKIPEVLEAAHIIPVNSGGSDEKENGFCMRVDIHRLFDSGNIRIKPNGIIYFSDAIKDSDNYNKLPTQITIPAFVNPENLVWRDKYC